jgi:hypothetical protein
LTTRTPEPEAPSPAAGAGGRSAVATWTVVAAFGVVAVPFAVAIVRLLAASGSHLTLPDDLALIDLHTREALRWQQQLGVFDHNGWNHPGPTYFYLLSVAYRLLGSGARAMFVGATTVNALSALACVWVVLRRAGPGRALWAAVWVALLGVMVVGTGPGSLTYSEGALGALVSPWNPTVVTFPLLLLLLLCAAAVARSGLSLLGALVVGSFIVQTNISCLPVVAAVLVVAAAGWVATLVRDRRRGDAGADDDRVTADPGATGHRRRPIGWAVAGVVALVAMWVPPVVQQLTNHPGNLTLIWRFFSAHHPGTSLGAALWTLAAVEGIVVEGTSEVMGSLLGTAPAHAGVAVAVTVVVVGLGIGVVVAGVRQRARFAAALGGLGLVGTAATVVAADRVVGPIFGYLVVWAVAVPVAVLIGVGLPAWPRPRLAGGRPLSTTPSARVVLAAVGVVVAVVLSGQVLGLPSLDTVSDPVVGELAALVTPRLPPGSVVFVGDNGFESDRCAPQLIPTEEFIGLVDQLDERGYHPKVNAFWQAQFGPGFQSDGHEPTQVELSQWTSASPAQPGYRGRIGEIAVTVSDTPDNLPASHCPTGL